MAFYIKNTDLNLITDNENLDNRWFIHFFYLGIHFLNFSFLSHFFRFMNLNATKWKLILYKEITLIDAIELA